MRPRALLALFPLLAAPVVARAQAADSSAFHRGQWGTEFSISGGFAAAGFLWFRSPTRALLMDVGVDYSHMAASGGTNDQSYDDVAVTLRLATRQHRPIGRRLYRLTTVGLSLSHRWYETEQNTSRSTSWFIRGGVFGDLGATWLVTPHLGLGARIGAAVSYQYGKTSGGGGSGTTKGLAVSLGDLVLSGQLYF